MILFKFFPPRGLVPTSRSCRTVVRITRLGLAGLIAVTLTAACQRSGSEVVVYTSEDQVFSEPVLKGFQKTTGIKVRAVYDTEETKSTGVALRIVAERNRPHLRVVVRQEDVYVGNEGPYSGRVERLTCLGGTFEAEIAGPGWRVWAIVREALKVGSDVKFAIAKSVIVPA